MCVFIVVSYAGHDSRVNNVCFSHSRYVPTSCGGDLPIGENPHTSSSSSGVGKGKYMLPSQSHKNYQLFSCSADGTARMWRLHDYDRAAVVFEYYQHSISASSTSATTASAMSMKGRIATSSSKHTTTAAVSAKGKTRCILYQMYLQCLLMVRSIDPLIYICIFKQSLYCSTPLYYCILYITHYMIAAGTQHGHISASTFGVSSNSSSKTTSTSSTARNRPYGEAVTHTGYYYMDRFAVLVRFAEF